MRYIKFRTLPNQGTKKIELVRVTDSGKIVPRGYGPLNLQVLDGNAANQGTLVTAPDILCFGATESIDDITITGTVDIYIDGESEPVLTNVSEVDIANLGESGVLGLFGAYEPEIKTPTEDWQVLIPRPTNKQYSTWLLLTLTLGVKFVDQPNVVFGATVIGPQTDEHDPGIWAGEYNGQLSIYQQTLTQWLKYTFDQGLSVELTASKYIPKELPWGDFYHTQYAKKALSSIIYGRGIDDDDESLELAALEFNFTLPANIEYIVLPILPKPYGDNIRGLYYSICNLNNNMKHQNIVYYADGRVEFDVPDIDTVSDQVYPDYDQSNIPKLSGAGVVVNVAHTVDISTVPVVNDYVSSVKGRVFDFELPYFWYNRATVTFTAPNLETPYLLGGVYETNLALNAQFGASPYFMSWMTGDNIMYDRYVEVTSNIGASTHVATILYPPSDGGVLRIKLPEETTSFEISFNT